MIKERKELEEEEFDVYMDEQKRGKDVPLMATLDEEAEAGHFLEEDKDVQTLVHEAKELLRLRNKEEARKLISMIEQRQRSIPDEGLKRQVGYDVLELKTDLKLLEL